MDEQEYRSTYHTVNKRRCVYEKAINSRRCNCAKCHRFNLADREGVACNSATGNALCTEFLNTLRSKARFSLHLTHADKPLPHTKEIKVQTGGLLAEELGCPVLGISGVSHQGLKQLVGRIVETLEPEARSTGVIDKDAYRATLRITVAAEG